MKQRLGQHPEESGSPAAAGGPLGESVGTLPQVGPVRARQFRRLGIGTIEDLLLTRPRRYEDRRERGEAAWLPGEPRALRVKLVKSRLRRWGWRKCLLEVEAVEEGSGRPLHLRWFNMPYLAPRMTADARLWVFGRFKQRKDGAWVLDAPEFEVETEGDESIHRDRIVPVYALGEKLTQRVHRAAVFAAIARLGAEPALGRPAACAGDGSKTPAIGGAWGRHSCLPAAARVGRRRQECLRHLAPEFSAAAIQGERGMESGDWLDAVRRLHFPESLSEAEAARRGLAFEEFLVWQTALALRRAALRGLAGIVVPPAPGAAGRVLERCGFQPTGAQRRVFAEISEDLARGVPMNRLLQGDVGSGKTLVAAMAIAQTAAAGFSSALMAPTELLARQHEATLRRLLEGAGLPVRLLTGSTGPAEEHPGPAVWVGTHALFQEGAELDRLGLVVIDEQHRFGVRQRARLRAKGAAAHLLVMSATPIPRTLGLALYGDLDVSVLDEKPPQRRPPETRVCAARELAGAWAFARARADEGRQVFVIFPAIGGGAGGLRSLQSEAAAIQERFRPHRVAIAHGRMAAAERDAAMADFASGRAAVLLATTLVEVGIDIPNAAVMVVEHAERFGLAQLHQMRGRVGRSGEPSWCLLVCRGGSEPARRRLDALAHNDDGFRIAEIDFQIRGPGEFLGKAQSGPDAFRLGNLRTDAPLLLRARDAARAIVDADPGLTQTAHAALAPRAKALAAAMDSQAVDPA